MEPFLFHEKQNVKDKVNLYIYLSVFFLGGAGGSFVKAVVENQMTTPQMVMYPHLLRGPVPMCVCQWGTLLGGGSIPMAV